MKKYVIWAALLFPMAGWSQSTVKTPWLERGQVQVGLGASAGYGNWTGGYLRATPYAQYFLKDNWAIRLEGRYNYNGPGGNQYIGAGLLTQYHFLRTTKLSMFGQAGYFQGQTSYGQYRSIEESPNVSRLERYRNRLNYGMLNVGLGAQYQISNRWSINALAEKNFGERVSRFPADGHNFNLGIGFRIK
jgi:hypothetical protein